MPRKNGVWLVVTAAVLICAGAAAARAASPPGGAAFRGDYKVTVRATNAKLAPSHWVYRARPGCTSPCKAVTFHPRLVTEKTWRKSTLAFHWNGQAYAYSKTLPNFADCRAKSGSTVKKGYDVKSKQTFEVHTVTNGRVSQWSGTGRDDYVPNAAGRAGHCVAGAYLYTLKAVAQ